jgi:hypothetical protein
MLDGVTATKLLPEHLIPAKPLFKQTPQFLFYSYKGF